MSTPTAEQKFPALNTNAFGTAGPQKISNNDSVQNSQVTPVIVKPTGFKTLEGSTPGDFRSQAAQPDPLKGNDTAPRAETTDTENAGA